MIKQLGLPIGFSFIIWIGAISFFIFFSKQLQLDVKESKFVYLFLILQLATLILLVFASFLYIKIDPSLLAGVKLALFGPAIGLFCDTFVLWKYALFFPELNEKEVIGFATWMAFAYVLFLFIPLLMTRERIKQLIRNKRGVSYGK